MRGRINKNIEIDKLALPIIGGVKIGKKTDRGYPTSVDYFIPTGKYEPIFTRILGDKPSTIQIVFVDDEIHKCCNEQYEYRDNKQALIARGNGTVFDVWNGRDYESINTNDYPNLMDSIKKRYPSKVGWSITLTLTFLIPQIRDVVGLWRFQTKGEASTIPQITSVFDAIFEERGTCKGIVFDLNVAFAKSQKPDNSNKFPVVTLVPTTLKKEQLQLK